MYRTCSSQSLCSLKTASVRGNGLRLTDLHTLFQVFLETSYLPYLCIFKTLPCQLCGSIPQTLGEQTKDLHMKLLVFTVRGPDNLCGDFFFRTFLSGFPFLLSPPTFYSGTFKGFWRASSNFPQRQMCEDVRLTPLLKSRATCTPQQSWLPQNSLWGPPSTSAGSNLTPSITCMLSLVSGRQLSVLYKPHGDTRKLSLQRTSGQTGCHRGSSRTFHV